MYQYCFFKDAYIYLLRTFEMDIKPLTIEKVLNFIKDNRLGGDDDYKLSAEYLENTIMDYLNEEVNHYEVEEESKKVFYEGKLFKLIREQILRDADEFLNSYFNLKEEINLRKIIDLKNEDRFFYIENQEEALRNLETFISDIDYEELDQEAENAYPHNKQDYKGYYAFKFLTHLLYQNNLKKVI